MTNESAVVIERNASTSGILALHALASTGIPDLLFLRFFHQLITLFCRLTILGKDELLDFRSMTFGAAALFDGWLAEFEVAGATASTVVGSVVVMDLTSGSSLTVVPFKELLVMTAP
ncbi:hypothetical protein TWF696_000893 [Orbilia brochopaga]|uniref:Uncharacterized protein n=1 Tax=Orbilia brochopaga TaxID=3140254 RepID=A0AAV9VJ10_9PEZI